MEKNSSLLILLTIIVFILNFIMGSCDTSLIKWTNVRGQISDFQIFRHLLNFINTLCCLIFVSGFEKGDHFALIINFELVVISHSTVDGLSVALCCASIATPVPELRSLKA